MSKTIQFDRPPHTPIQSPPRMHTYTHTNLRREGIPQHRQARAARRHPRPHQRRRRRAPATPADQHPDAQPAQQPDRDERAPVQEEAGGGQQPAAAAEGGEAAGARQAADAGAVVVVDCGGGCCFGGRGGCCWWWWWLMSDRAAPAPQRSPWGTSPPCWPSPLPSASRQATAVAAAAVTRGRCATGPRASCIRGPWSG